MNRVSAILATIMLVATSKAHAGVVIIWVSKDSEPPSLFEQLTQIWDVVLSQLATL